MMFSPEVVVVVVVQVDLEAPPRERRVVFQDREE
jgi:hypothetical protein